MADLTSSVVLFSHESAPFVAKAVLYPPGMRFPAHAHDYTGVSLVVAGSLRETANGRDEIAAAGSVVTKPAGTVHADEFGPHGALLIAVTTVPDHPHVPPDLHEIWRWLRGPQTTSAALKLGVALAACSPSVEDLVFDLWSSVTGNVVPSRGMPPRWIMLVRERVHDSPHNSTVIGLAREFGIHPVYLARVFRRWHGCSITEYSRHLVCSRTIDRTVWSSMSFSRIAYESGFADHSHMVRRVKAATGMTPTQLRALGQLLQARLGYNASVV